MAKQRRMRWLPRGAHRVALVRAAVLDGRLTSQPNQHIVAWLPSFLPLPTPTVIGADMGYRF
jgi:hypothetical protein